MVDEPDTCNECPTCDRSLSRARWFAGAKQTYLASQLRAAVAQRIDEGHRDCPPL